MKKVVIIILVLALVMAGVFGWWFIFHRLDGLLEEEISRAASEAMGTSVTLDDVRVDLLNGSALIENLSIANPEGFNRQHAFVFGSIEAAVDFKTGQISRVVLDDAQIFIEEKNGQINIQQLQQALESGISDSPGVSAALDAGQQEFVIQQFLMRSTMATFESDSLQRLSEIEIDQIEMRDLRGTPEQVAEQIAMEIVDEITDEAEQAMIRAQLENLQDRALEELKGLLGDDDDG